MTEELWICENCPYKNICNKTEEECKKYCFPEYD